MDFHMFKIDQDSITRAFESAGFDDVSFEDEIVARRGDEPAWEVVIDKAGRVKATLAEEAQHPHEQSYPLHNRKALVLIEHSVQVTVMFKLESPDELGDLLTSLDQISVRSEATPPKPKAAAPPPPPAEPIPNDPYTWDGADSI